MMEKQSPSFWDKFKKGFLVAKKSLIFIWHHKKLLFFPVLTATLIGSTIGVYDAVYYSLYQKHITTFLPTEECDSQSAAQSQTCEKMQHNLELALFSIIMTFASIFFFAFSNVALSYAASQAFINAPINIGASLLHSIKRLPTLLMWSVVASIVRIIVDIFRGKNKNGSSFLGRLIGEAIALAWYVGTFLVIPIMAHEQIGAFKSIQKSGHLMRKTFGENIVGAFVIYQLLFFSIMFLTLLAGVILLTTKGISELYSINIPMSIVFLMVYGPVAIGLAFVAIVSATMTVFKTASYYYAIGKPVGPFDTEEIRSSFVPKTENQ